MMQARRKRQYPSKVIYPYTLLRYCRKFKMDRYVTGETIKTLREKLRLTQAELAEKLSVSDKTVSKWETGKGYPDITLLEPLAAALGVSVAELISGEVILNRNVAANMLRAKFYVCPVCGNILISTGEALVQCHGLRLEPLEAEPADEAHQMKLEPVEDEIYASLEHPMTKQHYISFIAAVTPEKAELIKLYPEGAAEARFKQRGLKKLYYYCNRDGLFSMPAGRFLR